MFHLRRFFRIEACFHRNPTVSTFMQGANELSECVRKVQSLRVAEVPEQKLLTELIVAPKLAELLQLAREHRHEADNKLREELRAGISIPGAPAHEEYPIGHCGPICDEVFRRLTSEPLIQSLIASGVIWRRVYFIQDDSMFQNAIQCGNAILDVANDSVNPFKKPVEWYPLDGGFHWQNLDNYMQTAAVAERYYGVTLFPNRWFPLLAPLAPMIELKPDGTFLIFRPEMMLFFLDANEGWSRFRSLLSRVGEWERALPAAQRAFLQSCVSRAAEAPPPVELRECGEAEIFDILPQWEVLKTLPAERLHGALSRFDAALRGTNAWLAGVRQAVIPPR